MDYRKTAKRLQLALCRRGRRIKVNQMQYISKKTGCPATMYVVVETEVLKNGKLKNTEICTSPNIVDFERDIKNYIRRLKRIYRKAGIELKYIYVMEYSNTGRPHLHIILSGGVDRAVLEEAWGKGRCNADRLQFNECGVVDLSRYIGKDRRSGKRRYVTSKNLAKPVEKTNVHQWSRKQLQELDESGANPHKKFADTYHGYWLAEFPRIEKNGINGGMYMSFVMFNPECDSLMWYRI